jgi:hypothetical protein
MRWGLILLLSLFFVSFIIDSAFAAPFNLTTVPSQVGTQLGVGAFIGGLLCSLVVLMLILVPIMIMTKGKQFTLYLILTLVTLAPLTALGWFNLWVMILIVLAIAVKLGLTIADSLGGMRK